MSFIEESLGKGDRGGWFLAHDKCYRATRQTEGAVVAGEFYPDNDASTVEGIVYEDAGEGMPCSVVLAGDIYLDRLAETPADGVQSALEAKGFKFITNQGGGGGGGGAEVWLVGDTGESGMFTLSNVGDIDRMAELFTNGENYQVFANSEALPYYTAPTMVGGGAMWKDNATQEASTIILGIEQLENDEYSALLYYPDASTAPTSVEVSVAAK